MKLKHPRKLGSLSLGGWVSMTLLVLLCMLILIPIVCTFLYSFFSKGEISAYLSQRGSYDDSAWLDILFSPAPASLRQYYEIFIEDPAYLQFFCNSVMYSASILLGQALVIPLTAYAMAWHRRALQRKYATQFLPQTICVILAFILGYGVAAGFAALLLDFILQPVYVFPECVPSVLVEWEEIKRTFWQVQQSGAGFRELRTSKLIRLRYFAGVIPGCCAVIAVLIVTLFFKKNSSTMEK